MDNVAKTEPPPRAMLMEFLPLGNLIDQYKKSRFSVGECVAIIHQCALALEYLHSKHIAHRDLKPGNILVKCRDANRDPKGLHLKVSDFGISKVGDDLKTLCGTLSYTPPEMYLRVTPKYTTVADIWSLGVLVLECMCELPVPRSHGSEWCFAIGKKINSMQKASLTDLLRQMLQTEPLMRPTASVCAAAALRMLQGVERFPPPQNWLQPPRLPQHEVQPPRLPQHGAQPPRHLPPPQREIQQPLPPRPVDQQPPHVRSSADRAYRIWTSNRVQVTYDVDSINATHLLKLSGRSRYEMTKFFNKCPEAKKEMVHGRWAAQGTYIWLKYASAFCDHLGIPAQLRQGMPLPPPPPAPASDNAPPVTKR